MKRNSWSRLGFTLIELLVVVLIVGILAAVAVPQYKRAVERTKQAKALHFISTLVPALEQYYLENGTYATTFAQLPIDLPRLAGGSCKKDGDFDSDTIYVDGICLHLTIIPRGIRAYFDWGKPGLYLSRQVGKGYGYVLNNSFYSLKKGWYCFIGTNMESKHCTGTKKVENAFGHFYTL